MSKSSDVKDEFAELYVSKWISSVTSEKSSVVGEEPSSEAVVVGEPDGNPKTDENETGRIMQPLLFSFRLLCKIDSEGKARKVVGCSCLVVKDYGEETEGLHIVQEYVKSH
ncbi:hypothetical protein R6Q57_022652 [Mikania cordata]